MANYLREFGSEDRPDGVWYEVWNEEEDRKVRKFKEKAKAIAYLKKGGHATSDTDSVDSDTDADAD